MTRTMSVETLGLILDELAGSGRTDYVEETVSRAAATSQLPAWRIPGNWLPRFLATRSDPVELAIGRRSGLIIATTLLLVAALIAAAIAGSRPRLPPPFGLAGNGGIAFVRLGDIYVADTIDSPPRLLIGGPDSDGIPIFSPQGERLAVLRTPASPAADGDFVLMVANADGSELRQLSGPISGLNGIAWSPDASAILFGQSVKSASAIVSYAVAGGSPKVLDLGVPAEWPAIRPPDGRQFAFLGLVDGQWRLHIADVAGTGVRDLGLPAVFPAWSPDGRRLAFTDAGRIHVAEIDGAGAVRTVRPLEFDQGAKAEPGAVWSPDGSRLAFISGRDGKFVLAVGAADGADYREIGVEGGPANQSLTTVWMWSPDGRSVLQTFDDGPTWLLDPAGGPPRLTDLGTGAFSNWQRVAP